MRKKNVKKDKTVVIHNIPSKNFFGNIFLFSSTIFISIKKNNTVLIQNMHRKTFLSDNIHFYKNLITHRFKIKYNAFILNNIVIKKISQYFIKCFSI